MRTALDRAETALFTRGLGDFIPTIGGEALARVKAGMDGASLASFDPLMGAYNAILGNALDAAHGGRLEMLQRRPEGTDWCPLCYLIEKSGDPSFETWIEHAANDQKTIADSFSQPKTHDP